MSVSTYFVEPHKLHHFPELNPGRSDSESWGDPVKELAPSLAGGWRPTDALSVHPIADVQWDGVSVDAVSAQRQAHYNELLRTDTQQARIYQALYFRDGKPLPAEYMGLSGNRRSLALCAAIGQWREADPSRNLADYVVPIVVYPWVSELDSIRLQLEANSKIGERVYSPIGKVHIAQLLRRKGYAPSDTARSVSLPWGTQAQKIVYLADLANRYPGCRIGERIAIPRPAAKAGETVEYTPEGYIPYGPIFYKDVLTLMGERGKRKGHEGEILSPNVHRDIMGGHDGLATPQEVEQWIISLFGVRGKEGAMSPRKVVETLVSNFRAFPDVTAPIVEVLQAILDNNGGWFEKAMPKASPKGKSGSKPK
jgi:hypothetical protein